MEDLYYNAQRPRSNSSIITPLSVPNQTSNTIDKCPRNSHVFLPDHSPSHELRAVLTASQVNALKVPELLSSPAKWSPHLLKENSWWKIRYTQNYFTKMGINIPWKSDNISLDIIILCLPLEILTWSLNTSSLVFRSGLFQWFLPLCTHDFKTYLCFSFSKYHGLQFIFFACIFFWPYFKMSSLACSDTVYELKQVVEANYWSWNHLG